MEMKKIRKRFELADYLEEEIFLAEQHQVGWRMIDFKWFFATYVFEKCEPEDYIYQLDFKEKATDEVEYLQLFEDCGWEHFNSFGNWYYFRKPRSANAEENVIFNDAASRAEMAQKVIRFQIFFLLYVPLIFSYLLLARVNQGGLLLRIAFGTVWLIVTCAVILQVRNFWKLRKIVQANKKL